MDEETCWWVEAELLFFNLSIFPLVILCSSSSFVPTEASLPTAYIWKWLMEMKIQEPDRRLRRGGWVIARPCPTLIRCFYKPAVVVHLGPQLQLCSLSPTAVFFPAVGLQFPASLLNRSFPFLFLLSFMQ